MLCLCLAPFILLIKCCSVFPSGTSPFQLGLCDLDLEEADPTRGEPGGSRLIIGPIIWYSGVVGLAMGTWDIRDKQAQSFCDTFGEEKLSLSPSSEAERI